MRKRGGYVRCDRLQRRRAHHCNFPAEGARLRENGEFSREDQRRPETQAMQGQRNQPSSHSRQRLAVVVHLKPASGVCCFRNSLGEHPMARLKKWLNANASLNPTDSAIWAMVRLWSLRSFVALARCSCLRYSEKESPIYLRKIWEVYFSEYPRRVESSFNVRRSPLRLDSRADKRAAGITELRGVICGVGQKGCGLVRRLCNGRCRDASIESGGLPDETMPMMDVSIVRARRSWCIIFPTKNKKPAIV